MDLDAVYCDGRRDFKVILRDKSSDKQFLVDTGADLSVIPASFQQKRCIPHELELQAANNTSIRTYGQKILKLNLGFIRDFVWPFEIADIPQSIIGSDFLWRISTYSLILKDTA